MIKTLAFDIYGTLIDTHAVAAQLESMLHDTALTQRFTQQWRDKQLEYSFRRGLMGAYADFSTCTRQALDYCCELFSTPFTQGERDSLMQVYAVLPAYQEANQALSSISKSNFRLVAFSNGSASAVDRLLTHAGIRDYFEAIVSVEEIPSFKPDPRVYQHLLNRLNTSSHETMLVSSNPFDILGASHSDWKTAWISRGNTVFDPWGVKPDWVCSDLNDLAMQLIED